MRRNREEPGEWLTDETGRWYRKTWYGVEHEAEVNGIPAHLFRSNQKRQKELDAKRLEESRRKAAEDAARSRFCPFKDGVSRSCGLDQCALYVDDGCDLAPMADAQRDTVGKNCPLTKTKTACRSDCALYRGGCGLTTMAKKEAE